MKAQDANDSFGLISYKKKTVKININMNVFNIMPTGIHTTSELCVYARSQLYMISQGWILRRDIPSNVHLL